MKKKQKQVEPFWINLNHLHPKRKLRERVNSEPKDEVVTKKTAITTLTLQI